jgi:selenide,water dikinase
MSDKDVLVGLDVSDDAAVYRISESLAIVITVDFFTPIVDDPYAYGAIAAANSLSDIYAMGAKPILALNIAAFSSEIPLEVSAEILRGGAEKAREAGILVAGGHTVRDAEPKYGLVAVGTIDPAELTRKGGAVPGERLLLSKPLGSGVVTTGLMRDCARAEEVEAATVSMMRLNEHAAEVARAVRASAVTDITGFGLVGHASEMAQRGGVGFAFEHGLLPWLPGAERLGRAMTFSGGAHDNRAHFGPDAKFGAELDEWQQLLCFSPETSGGLLMAVTSDRVGDAIELAARADLELADVGEVVSGAGIQVRS